MTRSRGALDWVGAGVLAVLVLGVCLAFDPGGTDLERYHLPKEALLGVGACVLVLLRALAPGERRFDALDGALVAWVLVDVVSSLGAIDVDVAARATLLTGAAAAVAIDLRGRSAEQRRAVRVVALVAALAVAALVLAEAYRAVAPFSLAGYAPGATVGQRNNAAHVAALALAALAGVVLAARKRRTVALACVAVLPLAAAVIVTRSRTAWLAAGLGVLVACVAALLSAAPRLRTTLRTALLLAAVAAGAAVPFVATPRLSWSHADAYVDTARRLVESDTGSGQGRLVQWQTSLELVRERPLLGVGPGHWALHYPRIAAEGDRTVHRDAWQPTSRLTTNDFVAWLSERGVLGALVLLAMLALLVVTQARARHEPDPSQRIAVWGALAALAVVMTLDCALQTAPGVVALALLAPQRTESAPRVRAPVWFAAAAVLGLALLTTPRAVERAYVASRADRAHLAEVEALAARDPWSTTLATRLADHWLYAGDCRRALPYLDRLARLRPFHPRIVRDDAACHGHPPPERLSRR